MNDQRDTTGRYDIQTAGAVDVGDQPADVNVMAAAAAAHAGGCVGAVTQSTSRDGDAAAGSGGVVGVDRAEMTVAISDGQAVRGLIDVHNLARIVAADAAPAGIRAVAAITPTAVLNLGTMVVLLYGKC